MSPMRFFAAVPLCLAVVFVGCKGSAPAPTPNEAPRPTPTSDSGEHVKTTEIKIGKGTRSAQAGDTVWVQYRGTLKNGTEFDSNTDPKKDPLMFTVAGGTMIRGFDEGVPGMKVGGERRIEVPAALGYGAKAQDKIPANSDLIFTVKLLALVKTGEEMVIDREDIKPGTGTRVAKDGDTVTIKYVGSLPNGRVFETVDKPFTFKIGAEKALSAIDEGVKGMKVGGKRRIIAPPMVAYGQLGNPNVPALSVVVFDVELVSIK